MADFLFVKAFQTTNAKCYRWIGGTSISQIGGDVGSSNVETMASSAMPHNRAVEYKGKLYVWQRNVIYVYDPDANTWSVAHNVVNMNTSNNYVLHLGLYVLYVNNQPRIYGCYSTVSSGVAYVTFDGTTWSSNNILGGGAADTYTHTSIVYQNKLFWGYGGGIKIFDPSVPGYVSTTVYGGPPNTGIAVQSNVYCFVMFNQTLYLIGHHNGTYNAASDSAQIWAFQGGTFNHLQYLTSYIVKPGSNISQPASPAAFVAYSAAKGQDVIYTIMFGATITGDAPYDWCLRLTPNGSTFTVEDISSDVLPSSLLYPGVTPSAPNWAVYTDNDTDPANPVIHLWRSRSPFSYPWVHYQWVDESTNIGSGTAVDSPNYGWAPPIQTLGGGQYINSSGISLDIEITARTPVQGGMQYTFKAHGDPIVLGHGAVTNGPFVVGDVVTQTSPSSASGTIIKVNSVASSIEIGAVTGTFNNGSTITSGAKSATISSVAGGTNRVVKLYYGDQNGLPPSTQCTLTGAVTGGSAYRSTNQVNDVQADSLTSYTCIWDFSTDLVAVGAFITDLASIS